MTIAMLERFYDTVTGCMTPDSEVISNMSPRLHRRVAEQESTLYQGTIRGNITLSIESSQPVLEDTIIAVCRRASA